MHPKLKEHLKKMMQGGAMKHGLPDVKEPIETPDARMQRKALEHEEETGAPYQRPESSLEHMRRKGLEREEETGEGPPAYAKPHEHPLADVNGHTADAIPEHLHAHVKGLVKELHQALSGDKDLEDLEIQR